MGERSVSAYSANAEYSAYSHLVGIAILLGLSTQITQRLGHVRTYPQYSHMVHTQSAKSTSRRIFRAFGIGVDCLRQNRVHCVLSDLEYP